MVYTSLNFYHNLITSTPLSCQDSQGPPVLPAELALGQEVTDVSEGGGTEDLHELADEEEGEGEWEVVTSKRSKKKNQKVGALGSSPPPPPRRSC